MAKVTSTAGFNTIDPTSWRGSTSFMGSTQMTLTDGTQTARIEGVGLSYSSGGRLAGGTVTDIQLYRGEQLLGTVSDFAMAGSTVQSYLDYGDYADLFQLIQAGSDKIYGSTRADRLGGYDGDDYIFSGGGNDRITAGNGNDTVTLAAGSLFVYGGAGRDVVNMPGAAASFDYAPTSEGWQFWNHAAGINANLSGVERVSFKDGVLAFDTADTAGQAYRLYQAAFARDPDAGGLGYWIGRLDEGSIDLRAMADGFLYSREFASIYGTTDTVSNAEYVELLYLNTLGRSPEQGGYNFWIDALKRGYDRGDLLAHFSESNENKAQVAAEIDTGIWYT